MKSAYAESMRPYRKREKMSWEDHQLLARKLRLLNEAALHLSVDLQKYYRRTLKPMQELKKTAQILEKLRDIMDEEIRIKEFPEKRMEECYFCIQPSEEEQKIADYFKKNWQESVDE